MEPVTIAKTFRGLNNRIDPARLVLNLETGEAELTECVNMRFDDRGRPKRRPGHALRHGGNFHSLWTRYPLGYVGLDDAIYKINLDLSLTGVRSDLLGGRISYCWTPVGVYYANRMEKGVLHGDASSAWEKSDGARKDSPRHYTGPPDGAHHLELFAQRMLVTVGDTMYRSQPNDYGLYRRGADYSRLPGVFRMVRAVAGGVYVSDDKRTYFLEGKDPKEWTRITVMESPAAEWSDMTDLIDPKTIGYEGVDGYACWVSADGPVFGTPDGRIIPPPSIDQIRIPSGLNYGASVITGKNIIYNMHQ